MANIPDFTKKQIKAAKVLLLASSSVANVRAAQVVLFPALYGIDTTEVGKMTGMTTRAVERLQQSIRQATLKP